jgi:hypothetical protein
MGMQFRTMEFVRGASKGLCRRPIDGQGGRTQLFCCTPRNRTRPNCRGHWNRVNRACALPAIGRTICHGLYTRGMTALAGSAKGRGCIQFTRRNRKGWEYFNRDDLAFFAQGCALTLRGFPRRRPTIFELGSKPRHLSIPVLIMCEDEADLCIETSTLVRKVITRAGPAFCPRMDQTLNFEEPGLFNRGAQAFHQSLGLVRALVPDTTGASCVVADGVPILRRSHHASRRQRLSAGDIVASGRPTGF